MANTVLPVQGGPGFNTWSGNWIPHVASKKTIQVHDLDDSTKERGKGTLKPK